MKSKHLPLIGAALCLLFSSPAPSARGATRTWSGNGSGNWSNPTNWVGNLAPISGDDVIFPADAVRFETTNDLSSLRLKSITSGTSYFLRGNAITLTNGIHVLKFLCTIEFVITLGADQTFDCADGGFLTVEGNMANNGHVLTVTNGGTVTLNGIISGTGGLAKTGDGHLEIVGANTYSGLTTVNQGFVFAENAAAFGGSAAGTVLNGGTIVVSLVDVLTESLTNNSSLDCLELYGRWGSNIVLNADLTVYVEDLFTGAVSGVVSGTGGLFKIGGATLRLSGANTYSGLTTVATGTLLVDNSQPESPVTVIDLFIRSQCGTCRATLGGVGTVGTITNLTGGTVGPGSSAGILTSSNVVFAPGAILSVELNGTAVGAGYDQLKARGAVSLSNATLKVAMGFVPAVGNRFTIIDNDGADAVIGTFNGLPESALFASGPALLRISYAGGTGNDVTLTVVQLIKVWTGLINGNWSNPTNWLGAIAPQVGEALVFPPDAVRFTMTNDFAPARLFDRATFTGSNYLLRGLSLILNNGIRAGQVLGTNAIETDVELRAFQSFVVSNSPASLIVRGNAVALGANALTVDGAGGVTISAAIGGSSSLTKQGAGTLEFSGATSNTFAGGVAVLQGTLLLNKTAFDGAIPASLQAGSLAAPPLPLTTNATVRWGRSNQVNNAAAVLATSDALLDLRPGADEIGSLRGSGSLNLGATGLATGGDGLDTVFDGTIGGLNGRLSKKGGGRFTLNGTNDYPGLTQIIAGTLEVNGFQPASGISISSGSVLAGRGVVGMITNALGEIRPGASPGVLTSSNLMFAGAASAYVVELNGPALGTGYDSMTVRGLAQVNNAFLVVSIGYAPDEGQQFLIMDNDGMDAVSGVFRDGNGTGLPLNEGSTFSAGGLPLRVSYAGGTGNDVTLTVGRLALGAGGFAVQAGNGNGRVDVNECNNLLLEVVNRTNHPLAGVTARLTSATPGVSITERDAAYPTIPAGGTATNLTPFQFHTTPDFVCGTTIEFILVVTTPADGRFAVRYVVPSGSTGPDALFSNNTPLVVPDTGLASSPITVSGISGSISGVTVSVSLTNSVLFNLGLVLRSPDGTQVPLFSKLFPFPGDRLGTNCAAGMTTFSDGAPMSISAGTPPYAGQFLPQLPLAAFNGKSGTNANGLWRLLVSDNGDADGSEVRLECWTLKFNTIQCDDGGGPCALCNGPFLGSITTNDTVLPFTMDIFSGPTACGSPAACGNEPANFIPSHYDLYTYTNGGPTACVTVELTMPCAGPTNVFFSGAYAPAFDPGHHCAGLIGASGRVTSGFTNYSFTATSNGVFRVLVISLGTSLCSNYTLRVDGFDCPVALGFGMAATNQTVINWPTFGSDFQLQCVTNVSFTNAIVVTNMPTASNGQFVLTNTIVSPLQFYRLVKP